MTAQHRTDNSLAAHTTLRLGGPARAVVVCSDTASLVDTVTGLDARGESVLLIGGGSNLVISDDGFDGTAVIVASDAIAFDDEDSRPF
ncbi:MAG: UDP-N-acetylmuramate dehydrogenase, partial [Gordonia sp. (in: high G+C Gram-positive bacteria)]